jgi:uncharacterized membrane protein (GlpM family)
VVILLFKLFTTPTLILIATLVSRRFGQATGGWLVGLPLTSGPIAVFLAIEHGAQFSQAAASGSLEGPVGQAFFATAYAALARRRSWPVCLAGGAFAFLASGLLLGRLHLPMPVLAAAACASLAGGLLVIGKPAGAAAPVAPPRWDLPVRMAVATGLVLLITSVASVIGPDLSGLAATFPVFAIVLSVFAHRHQGAAAAQSVMRGLVLGLFGFVGFFAAVSFFVTRIDLVPVFAIALGVNLAIHGAAFVALRRAGAGNA